MRLVQISVPDDRVEGIVGALRDRDLDYTEIPTKGDEDHTLVNFVVPADAVEHVLDDLHENGLDPDSYTVSIKAEFAIFEGIDEVQERWANTPNQIAPRTLRSKAKDLRLNTRSYLWMMLLSTVIATAGLLLNSPAVVVGAMVLAPLVSPMLTASVGAVRDDRKMVVSSLYLQVVGLGTAVIGAILLAALIRYLGVVPGTLSIRTIQVIGSRVSPSILAIAVGLASGAAAAFGLATKGEVSIVGVMIAAALVPSAATAGIGVAWGQYVVAVGALLLLALNVVLINVSGFLMLWYLGYRPDDIDESMLDIDSIREAAAVGATVLIAALVVLAVGAGFVYQSSFERSVNDVVTDTLDDDDFSGLAVEGTTIAYSAPGPLDSGPISVTVVIARTTDQSYPELPQVLDRRITEQTGREVIVRINYVDYESSAETNPDR